MEIPKQKEDYIVSTEDIEPTKKHFETADQIFKHFKREEPEPSCFSESFTSNIQSSAISPNEKFFYFGLESGLILVYSLKKKAVIYELEGHILQVKSLKSTESILISASYDCTIRVWSNYTFQQERVFSGHTQSILSLEFVQNTIFTTSLDKTLRIWELHTPNVTMIPLENYIVYDLAVSKNKKFLILACSDHILRIWNVREKKVEDEFRQHIWPITSVALSQDEEFIITGSMDFSTRVWKWTDMTKVPGIIIREETVNLVCITTDNEYGIYSDCYGNIGIFDLHHIDFEVNIEPFNTRMTSLCVSESGDFLVATSENAFEVIYLTDSNPNKQLKIHNGQVNDLAISKDSSIMASVGDNELIIWDLLLYSILYKTEIGCGYLQCVDISKDKSYCVLGGSDCRVRIWNISAFKEKISARRHSDLVYKVKFSVYKDYIFSSSRDKSIQIMNYELEVLHTLKDHRESVRIFCETDLFFVSGSDDGSIIVWLEFRQEKVLKSHKNAVTSLVWIKNSDLLISGGHDGIKLWNLEEMSLIINLSIEKINSIDILEGLHMLVVSNNRDISLWSLENRQILGKLYSVRGAFTGKFSPDLKTIVFNKNKSIVFAPNPVIKDSENFTVIPFKYSYIFRVMVYNLLNQKKYAHIVHRYYSYSISPFNINLMHILSYLNYGHNLKKSIKEGGKFLKSSTGETPLTIALKRKSKNCSDIIIHSFSKYLLKVNPHCIEFITPDIIKLNRASLPHLHLLYEAAFPEIEKQFLPTYGIFKSPPPLVRGSEAKRINPDDFIIESHSNTENELEFKGSLFKLNLALGSIDSINFFTSLLECKNTEIFRTDFIEAVIHYKWNEVLKPMWIQTGIYLIFLFFLLLHILYDEESIMILSIICVLNTGFLLNEILQVLAGIKFYLKDPLNILDMMRISGIYLYLILAYLEEQFTIEPMLSVLTLICFWRLVGYIRMYAGTRALSRIIIETFNDMIPFFFIYHTSIFAFSLAFFIVSDHSFLNRLTHSYELAYGGFNTEGYDLLEILVFFAGSIWNPMVLLNLLIAIMADTFDKVKSNWDIADKLEKTNMILEIDSIHFVGRNTVKFQYIHECSVPENSVVDYEEIWLGKARTIIKKIRVVEDKVAASEKKLKEIERVIEHLKLRRLKGEIEIVFDEIEDANEFEEDMRKELYHEFAGIKEDIRDILYARLRE